MAAEKLVIDRLTIRNRNPAIAGHALKLGLEQALRQVRLQSAHLSPQAILVIRRLECRSIFGRESIRLHQWQQQVEVQLGELARNARRPAYQHIPPQANSICFDDEVDLLMCYTRDLLAGRIAWYWQDLFPFEAYPGQGDGQRLSAAWLTYPQAIPRHLVNLQPEEASEALNRLSQVQLMRLAQSLHETFALPGNPPDISRINWSSWAEERVNLGSHRNSGAIQNIGTQVQHPPSPWNSWFSSSRYRHLSPPATYLLGLSHMLVKQPQQVRQPAFFEQVRLWVESDGLELPDQLKYLPEVDSRTEPVDLSADDDPANSFFTPDRLSSGIFTRLGGAIFFINLMIHLQLPKSIPPLAELNSWELLGGLVIGLLGRSAEEFALDPLWPIISKLSEAAPGQPWGVSLAAPDTLTPDDWHTLTDKFQFTHSLEGWGDPAEWSNLANQWLAPNLAWWVRQLQPFLSQLLADLIGNPAAAVETLFRQPSTLYISQTHVDLLLSVDQIRLPLRRAGLDRTPGWRPEFGHIVTIHFE